MSARLTLEPSYGFIAGDDGYSFARGLGRTVSPRAFGHTGFTGTSMWIDPERELFVIVLTNHVLPSESPVPLAILADVRADVADVATIAMDAVGDSSFVFRADRKIGWR